MIKALYLLIISFLIISFGYLPRAITPKPALNIFVWGDFFDEKTLSLFTKETGIPIHVHYYTSNEELLLKLEKTNGAGYDLLFPSDYTVPLLKEKGLLQPLDHSRLPIASIDPSLLGLPFDPENSTLPYFWEIYGITWKGDLDPLFHGHQKVVMIQDPTEAFSLAAHHLGSNDKQAVLHLLQQQRPLVEAYTDHRAHYLLATDTPPLAILRSSFFFKHEDIIPTFHPPKEATFATIENVALSSKASHIDAAYAFLNFIYRPDVMALQIDKGPLFPACKEALLHTKQPLSPAYHELLNSLNIKELNFFTPPDSTIRPLWVELQTS